MFVFERAQYLGHDLFDIAVGEGLVRILDHEVKSILLLACRDLVAAVNVEERYVLEHLLLCLESGLAQLAERNVLVQEQGQVATNLGIAGHFFVFNPVAAYDLEENRP